MAFHTHEPFPSPSSPSPSPSPSPMAAMVMMHPSHQPHYSPDRLFSAADAVTWKPKPMPMPSAGLPGRVQEGLVSFADDAKNPSMVDFLDDEDLPVPHRRDPVAVFLADGSSGGVGAGLGLGLLLEVVMSCMCVCL